MTYFKSFKQLIQILLIVTMVLVFYSLLSSADPTVEHYAFLVLFVLWNCIPLLISFLLIFILLTERYLTQVKELKIPILLFAIINIGITTFFHLAWIFDGDKTASGSSTSGLIFIFIPIYSGIIATVIASVSFVICMLRNLYMKIAVAIIVITTIVIIMLSNFMNEQGYYGKYDSRRDVDEQIAIELADPDQVIHFEDQAFEMAIRDCFDLDDGDITWKDIGYRTELDSDDFQPKGRINTLEDLKWFVNLKKIEMQEHEVEGDLSSFSHMESLEVLLMWKTDVSGDLSSLSGLKNLRLLNLSHTDVEGDISNLNTLVNLEELELKGTDVEGYIDSLNALKKLKFIELSDTNVSGR